MKDFHLKFNWIMNRVVNDRPLHFTLNDLEFTILNFHRSVPEPGSFIAEHEHPYHTLDLVEFGSMATVIDQVRVHSGSNTEKWCFVPQARFHQRRFGNAGPHQVAAFNLQIYSSDKSDVNRRIAGIAAKNRYEFSLDPGLKALWKEIIRFGEEETPLSIPALRHLLPAFLILFFRRNFAEIFTEGNHNPFDAAAFRNNRAGIVKWLLSDKIRDTNPACEIARQFELSVRHLNRIFQRETGMTVKAYQTKLRVETARKLLAGTALPIAEIGEAVGYHRPTLFSVFFRKHCRCSPQEYRERHSHRSFPSDMD